MGEKCNKARVGATPVAFKVVIREAWESSGTRTEAFSRENELFGRRGLDTHRGKWERLSTSKEPKKSLRSPANDHS